MLSVDAVLSDESRADWQMHDYRDISAAERSLHFNMITNLVCGLVRCATLGGLCEGDTGLGAGREGARYLACSRLSCGERGTEEEKNCGSGGR